jgi:hypothetical protein
MKTSTVKSKNGETMRNRRFQSQLFVTVAFLMLVGWPTLSRAGNQGRAGVNLGSTSFMDGFGRAVDGLTYQGYLTYSMGRAIYDPNGNKITAFVDPKIDSYNFTNQFSYYFPTTWLGDRVRPALNFLLPLVGFDTSFGAVGPSLTNNGIGFGDFTMGPMFQFKPLMLGERPFFAHRLEIDLVAPIGKYDPHKNINQGSNFISFIPHWAATLLPLPGLELSVRIHYIYNFRNDRPTGAPTDPNAADTTLKLNLDSAQAGQAFFFNFATSYEIIKSLHIGANGYFLTQLTDDRFTTFDKATNQKTTYQAKDLPGEGKAQVFAIGPGGFWELAKTDKLFVNVYFQPVVKARTQSTVFNLRWVHSF